MLELIKHLLVVVYRSMILVLYVALLNLGNYRPFNIDFLFSNDAILDNNSLPLRK